jgi:aconitate hydratase
VDCVVDHSVIADHAGTADAAERNIALEFNRNRERYEFLRWGAQAFDNLHVIPPGSGICHQINLEHLARVVWTRDERDRTLAYPDSVLGLDSHTPMINSLGVLGWGVGGLEGGSAALGERVWMLLPEVIGCRLSGSLKPAATTTDLVLTVAQVLRRHQLLGKFVEFFGPGVLELTLPDRATIANMTPEYGATVGFFSVDRETLRYLRLTGRDAHQLELVEAYTRAQGLWRDDSAGLPEYTDVVEIDLARVEPSVAGPKRPQDRVPIAQAPGAFRAEHRVSGRAVPIRGSDYELKSGDVVVAAITSCTNTSNPSVMIAAGLLARNAVAKGLTPKPWVKTTLSPGSLVVTDYLAKSGLQQSLDVLGFTVVGYGCMTCMGNSGPLADPIAAAIAENDLAVVAVLSGNRNFAGRVHMQTRASFLASPPLVVAYAIAGTILTDLTREPIGIGGDGQSVFLSDVWPNPSEIRKVIDETLSPDLFRDRYARLSEGTPEWQRIDGGGATTFAWKPGSTFIRRPPFFDDMRRDPAPITDIKGAHVLAMFGDMLTTDHISPVGVISPDTPAAAYLASLGIAARDFVSYAARRLNHDVMIRGTFGNIRIQNELVPGVEGGTTRHYPSGETMSIFDAAERYGREHVPLVVVAGAEYGGGSSRDWAAKGIRMLGVRAVIAESFERIHRTNLVAVGVLPLQWPPGVTRQTLRLDGSETFDITGLALGLTPRQEVTCTITRRNASQTSIALFVRLDTRHDVECYRHGGELHYVLRRRLEVQ